MRFCFPFTVVFVLKELKSVHSTGLIHPVDSLKSVVFRVQYPSYDSAYDPDHGINVKC